MDEIAQFVRRTHAVGRALDNLNHRMQATVDAWLDRADTPPLVRLLLRPDGAEARKVKAALGALDNWLATQRAQLDQWVQAHHAQQQRVQDLTIQLLGRPEGHRQD